MRFRYTPTITHILFRGDAAVDLDASSGSIYFGLGNTVGNIPNATATISVLPHTTISPSTPLVSGSLDLSNISSLVDGQSYNLFLEVETHGASGSISLSNYSFTQLNDPNQYVGSGSAGDTYHGAGGSSPDTPDSYSYFYGAAGTGFNDKAHWMKWDEADARFGFSDSIAVNQGGASKNSAIYFVHPVEPAGSIVYSYTNTSLTFNNFVTVVFGTSIVVEDNAQVGDILYMGPLGDPGSDHPITWRKTVGESTSGVSLHYDWVNNYFNFDSDLHVINLKADSNIHINNSGPDGDSFVYFYDGGSPTGQSLQWDDSENEFSFSADITVNNTPVSDTPYGEMFEHNDGGSVITIGTAGDYHGWVTASSGSFNRMTADLGNGGADHLIIQDAGTYFVASSITLEGEINATIQGTVCKNGTPQTNLHFHRDMGTVLTYGVASISGLLVCATDDEIDLRFTSDGNGDDVTVTVVNLTAHHLTS